MTPETTITADGRSVTLIHFVVEGRIVCMPNMLPKDMASSNQRAAPHMRTDSAAGVTCQMCRKTSAWIEAKK